jgi:nardilysin
VRAGSFHDPPELPGLAHLLEHMLFMGSQKYPGENEFDSFISQHGGSNDASTDYETTMFYFEINKRHFKEALDKFAHFFICPLLQESSLEKEIEAVDSEFHNSYQSDSNRLQQLLCSLAADGHPLRNFPWGNRDTLKISPQQKGINVTEHLREFYHLYYSASYMTLAVVSEDPLEMLQDWVQYSFRDLPSNGRPFPSINHYQTVFSNENFHRMYKIIPVKDTDKLILTWLLPSLYPHYREKPVGYLSSLIGHEGYGSIMSLLKEMNLATGLVAGCGSEDYENNSSFSLFTCSVYLTENGVKHFQEVLLIIFQYLKLLHQEGPQERYYKEIQTIEKNSFIYEEEDENVELVQDLCGSMIVIVHSIN